jgi:hypothetical protein
MRLTRSLLVGSAAALTLIATTVVADPGGGKGGGGGGGGGGQHGDGGGGPKGGNGGGGGNKGGGAPQGGARSHSSGNAGGGGRQTQISHGDGGGRSDGGPKGGGNPHSNERGSSSQTAHAGGKDNGGEKRDVRGTGNAKNAHKERQGGSARMVETGKGDRGGKGNNAKAFDADRGGARVAGRTLRGDLKQQRFKGSGGREFVVPANDRVRVVTTRQDFNWGRLDGRVNYKGCPPGLAKKYNGCNPPGQVRPGNYGWYEPDWYWSRYYDRGANYRYHDGYLLRYGGGDILSYIPLLGGALLIGAVWPGDYQPVALPPYYADYYDLGPATGYRYYDDAIYTVDPRDSQITGVAALLMGNDIVIGEPMPMGYDVYNVPYDYRDQYIDGPDAYYRYSDGFIYQLDPTTRLVQAAIELLA